MGDAREKKVIEIEIDAADADDGEACARLLELVSGAAEAPAPEPAATIIAAVIPERIAGVVIGRLAALDGGEVVVLWAGAPEGARAHSLTALEAAHVGREVALSFVDGDPARPMVMGVVEPFAVPRAPVEGAAAEGLRVEVAGDKRRLVLEAADELVLRAGDASITLTRAGKLILRGAYVSSNATGVNRIQGGAVEID